MGVQITDQTQADIAHTLVFILLTLLTEWPLYGRNAESKYAHSALNAIPPHGRPCQSDRSQICQEHKTGCERNKVHIFNNINS
jgi:hypothetical protein